MRNWLRCTVALCIMTAPAVAQKTAHLHQVLISRLTGDSVQTEIERSGFFLQVLTVAENLDGEKLLSLQGIFQMICPGGRQIPIFVLFPKKAFLSDRAVKSELDADRYRGLPPSEAVIRLSGDPVLHAGAFRFVVSVMKASCFRPDEEVQPGFFVVFSIWKDGYDRYKIVHQRVNITTFEELSR